MQRIDTKPTSFACTSEAATLSTLPNVVVDRIGSYLGHDAAMLSVALRGSRLDVKSMHSIKRARAEVATIVHRATQMDPSFYEIGDHELFRNAGKVLHLAGPRTRAHVLRHACAVDQAKLEDDRFAVLALAKVCSLRRISDLDASTIIRSLSSRGGSSLELIRMYHQVDDANRQRIREKLCGYQHIRYPETLDIIATIPGPFLVEFLSSMRDYVARDFIARLQVVDRARILSAAAFELVKSTNLTTSPARNAPRLFFEHYAGIDDANRRDLWALTHALSSRLESKKSRSHAEELYLAQLTQDAFPHRASVEPAQITAGMQQRFHRLEST